MLLRTHCWLFCESKGELPYTVEEHNFVIIKVFLYQIVGWEEVTRCGWPLATATLCCSGTAGLQGVGKLDGFAARTGRLQAARAVNVPGLVGIRGAVGVVCVFTSVTGC